MGVTEVTMPRNAGVNIKIISIAYQSKFMSPFKVVDLDSRPGGESVTVTWMGHLDLSTGNQLIDAVATSDPLLFPSAARQRIDLSHRCSRTRGMQ